MEKIILAYSEGLDTLVILKWLMEKYEKEGVVFSVDLGQADQPSFENLEEKALKTGASKAYIEDLKKTFVQDYVFPMFRANTIYESKYLLGTAISRPLIAKRQMEIAKIENANAISHGATGKGNGQIRFETVYLSVDSTIEIIVPWKTVGTQFQNGANRNSK